MTTIDFPSQAGRRAVVTGTGGLGLEAAIVLARLGAHVTLAGRNPDKGGAAISQAQQAVPGANVRFEALDLADLSSVKAFADRMIAEGEPLDILINNAGIMMPRQLRRTADGFEAQMGTNHLGHFALTARLLPLLCKSNAARVVNVSSLAHRQGKIDFDNLKGEKLYNPGLAYCQSKLAVALFARQLQKQAEVSDWPIISLTAHPGFAGTNLFAAEQGKRSLLTFFSEKLAIPLLGQSAAAGALPLVHAAVVEDVRPGALYGPTGFMEMRGPPGLCSYAKGALDDETARRLWQVSEQMVNLKV
jgi:NAD(P)-dependent dehydrogenase (short-subunit alcohol dehydrogenase family)